MRSSPGLLRESQVRDLAVLRRSASIDDGVALRCEPGKNRPAA
jgi:hypothetical protein